MSLECSNGGIPTQVSHTTTKKKEMEYDKEKIEYKFKTFYDKKSGQGVGVKLEDGTIVIGDPSSKCMRIAYPKKKFTKIFTEQIKDESKEYIEVAFAEHELEAILRSLDSNKQTLDKEKEEK